MYLASARLLYIAVYYDVPRTTYLIFFMSGFLQLMIVRFNFKAGSEVLLLSQPVMLMLLLVVAPLLGLVLLNFLPQPNLSV